MMVDVKGHKLTYFKDVDAMFDGAATRVLVDDSRAGAASNNQRTKTGFKIVSASGMPNANREVHM